MLKVTEFFPSLQGEGILIGTPTYFIRLSRCNLQCKFCDTKYSWKMGKLMTEEELWSEIKPWSNLPRLCITGGEPMLQGFQMLCEIIKNRSAMQIDLETNGTISCHPMKLKDVDVLTISPKLSNSGMKDTINRDTLNELLRHPFVQLKFVCESCADVSEALELVNSLHAGERASITFQPQGLKFKKIKEYLSFLRELWEYVKGIQTKHPQYDLHVLPQLHRMLFGQRRGV